MPETKCLKQSNFGWQWNQRNLVLTQNELRIFNSDSQRPKRIIDMRDPEVKISVKKLKGKRLQLILPEDRRKSLMHSKRNSKLVFEFGTEEERDKWVRLVEQTVKTNELIESVSRVTSLIPLKVDLAQAEIIIQTGCKESCKERIEQLKNLKNMQKEIGEKVKSVSMNVSNGDFKETYELIRDIEKKQSELNDNFDKMNSAISNNEDAETYDDLEVLASKLKEKKPAEETNNKDSDKVEDNKTQAQIPDSIPVSDDVSHRASILTPTLHDREVQFESDDAETASFYKLNTFSQKSLQLQRSLSTQLNETTDIVREGLATLKQQIIEASMVEPQVSKAVEIEHYGTEIAQEESDGPLLLPDIEEDEQHNNTNIKNSNNANIENEVPDLSSKNQCSNSNISISYASPERANDSENKLFEKDTKLEEICLPNVNLKKKSAGIPKKNGKHGRQFSLRKPRALSSVDIRSDGDHENQIQGNGEGTSSERVLNLNTHNLKTIPFIESFYSTVILSKNNIKSLESLSNCSYIKTLILDNNSLSSLDSLPYLPNVETLWLNNNCLSDLKKTIKRIKSQCPIIQHISLIGNECCMKYLLHEEPDAYTSYRKVICKQLSRLATLDFMDVANNERATIEEFYANANRKRRFTQMFDDLTIYKN